MIITFVEQTALLGTIFTLIYTRGNGFCSSVTVIAVWTNRLTAFYINKTLPLTLTLLGKFIIDHKVGSVHSYSDDRHGRTESISPSVYTPRGVSIMSTRKYCSTQNTVLMVLQRIYHEYNHYLYNSCIIILSLKR